MSEICSVVDCNKLVDSHGWCHNHYVTRRRYGSVSGKPHVEKKCNSCEKIFTTNRNAKYCCNECYRKSSEYKESRARSKRRWKISHKLEHASNKKVSKAVKSGKLKKEACETCGDDTVEGHHEDYAKPLDVNWLCGKCHTRLGVEMRKSGASAVIIKANNKRRGTWHKRIPYTV